tara:strand:+ start:798 stop:959 length:162 start_codon:yes stop_codon:yes gene_type:complete
MAALLKRAFHVIKLCIVKMIERCYATNLILGAVKFVATLFTSIVMSDAKEMLE